MSLIGSYFAPLRMLRRLLDHDEEIAKLTRDDAALLSRICALEAQMNGPDVEHFGVKGIVDRIARCERCGQVYLGGNGLVKLSANIEGEVRPVVVCGTCRHLLKSSHRA